MKKLLIPAALMISTLSMAQDMTPANPMDGYEMSNHQDSDLSVFWRSMRTDLKGKDCYRRAHLWSYGLDRNYNVKSGKIFIHYTDKFNRELDNLGRDNFNWWKKLSWGAEGISSRLKGMVKSNTTWDYHVAPLVLVDGKETVLDRYLSLPYDAKYPYTANEAWDLKERPATPEEWVEALTVRGELLWQARKAELEENLAHEMSRIRETDGKKRRKALRAYREYYDSYQKLNMIDNDSIDIKCQRVESIVEVDKNHDTAWCFYTVAPMYYYNEIDLRYLAYGNTGYRYNMAVPMDIQTPENYVAGREFIQTFWNEKELEDAEKEIKPEY